MSSEVAEAMEVWALVAVNFLGFFLAAFITAVSYYAYRSGEPKSSLRNATVGFGLLALGIALEPLYQVGVQGSHVLASERNVTLQLIEGAVFSLGLLVLFTSIYRYRSRAERRTVSISGVDDELFEDLE